MVEINRALYVGKQDGNTAVVPPDADQIAALQECVWEGIEKVLDNGK